MDRTARQTRNGGWRPEISLPPVECLGPIGQDMLRVRSGLQALAGQVTSEVFDCIRGLIRLQDGAIMSVHGMEPRMDAGLAPAEEEDVQDLLDALDDALAEDAKPERAARLRQTLAGTAINPDGVLIIEGMYLEDIIDAYGRVVRGRRRTKASGEEVTA